MLKGMLPPELAATLPELVRDMTDELEEPDEPAQHPCAAEVNACIRETGDQSRSAIEGCLVRHIQSLSDECKCFVHHITGNPRSPPAVKPAASAAGVVPVKTSIRSV